MGEIVKYEWRKNYITNIDRVDSEHKIFFDLINEIYSASINSSSLDRIKRMLAELIKYAEFHFISEENLMLDIEYPEIESHKDLHEKLIKEIKAFKGELEHKPQGIHRLVQFLFEWFINHTINEDKKITKYFLSS